MSTDLHTLSGAYVLHALSDPDEASAFRAHLDACAACREEVRELQEAAAKMGAAEALAPPADVKARVLEAADRLPQLPPRVTPIQRARSARWSQRLLGAAAALVLVLGAVFGVSQIRGGEPELTAAVAQVFEAPDVRTADVETDHGTLRVAASPGRNEMAVDTRDLDTLSAAEVYQLWAVVDGVPTSAGIVENPDAGAAMTMPASGTEVAITVEPAGGSEQPTTDPIAQLDPASI